MSVVVFNPGNVKNGHIVKYRAGNIGLDIYENSLTEYIITGKIEKIARCIVHLPELSLIGQFDILA